MSAVQIMHGFRAATFDGTGRWWKVHVGKTKQNKASILCSLMESLNIEIVISKNHISVHWMIFLFWIPRSTKEISTE